LPNTACRITDLFFHFLAANAPLPTYRPAASGAMIVGVMEKQRVHHFLNRSLATRAGITISVGKFSLGNFPASKSPLSTLDLTQCNCEWEWSILTFILTLAS
jgi:hypothetical protein